MTSLAIHHVERKESYYGYPITPQRELLTWLQTIHRHAEAGSRESRAFLVTLSKRMPDCSFAPQEIKEGVEEITRIAATNEWSQELPSLTSSTYSLVCKLYFPEIKDLT
jgi:hypothetical protein